MQAARQETTRPQPAKNTGFAAREAEARDVLSRFHPTPVQWAFLGGIAAIVLGFISMLFRRHRIHRL